MISPSADQLTQVVEWLHCNQLLSFTELKKSSDNSNVLDGEIICYQSIHKDFIYIKSTVRTMEIFFNVELSEYHFHPSDGVDLGEYSRYARSLSLIRAEPTSEKEAASLVPANLHSIVSRVYGITELPPIDALFAKHRIDRRGQDTNAIQAREPGDQITPPVIWKTYGLDTILPLNSSLLLGNTSCAEFQDEEFLQTDVTKFESLFGLPDVKVDIIGANNGGYFGEGSLDTEYLTGTAPGLGVTWIGIPWGSSFTSGSYYCFLLHTYYISYIYLTYDNMHDRCV